MFIVAKPQAKLYDSQCELIAPIFNDVFFHVLIKNLELKIQNSTLGTSRSASFSISKKSRLPKLNIPAMMFDGNIWILLL